MAAPRIHHLDCGTLCPLAGSLMGGQRGPLWQRGHLVCHCLLIESADGLVLVEAGLGTRDLATPSRLPASFRFMTQPLKTGPTALQHVLRLGFQASDVRHILLTHLDLDHAGGISDFPNAKVHVWQAEYDAAMSPGSADAGRYLATQWQHDVDWKLYDNTDGEAWFGFDQVQPVTELGGDLALIPLAGHSKGHCAIAVRAQAGWILHCGDAYIHRGDIRSPPIVPFGIRAFQRTVDTDHHLGRRNMARVRRLQNRHSDEISIICAHDPTQLRQLQG